MSAPLLTDLTSPSTEQLISQLALSATWLHLDGRRPGPVQAAVEVLEVRPDDALLAEVDGAVRAAASELDWTEQVAYALHLLLTTESVTELIAA